MLNAHRVKFRHCFGGFIKNLELIERIGEDVWG